MTGTSVIIKGLKTRVWAEGRRWPREIRIEDTSRLKIYDNLWANTPKWVKEISYGCKSIKSCTFASHVVFSSTLFLSFFLYFVSGLTIFMPRRKGIFRFQQNARKLQKIHSVRLASIDGSSFEHKKLSSSKQRSFRRHETSSLQSWVLFLKHLNVNKYDWWQLQITEKYNQAWILVRCWDKKTLNSRTFTKIPSVSWLHL